jgi:transposase
VIDAIAFKYRTGLPWTDLPAEFGSWKGVHNRLRKWAADGTWQKVLTALLAQTDAEGDLDWLIAVDSTAMADAREAWGLGATAGGDVGVVDFDGEAVGEQATVAHPGEQTGGELGASRSR